MFKAAPKLVKTLRGLGLEGAVLAGLIIAFVGLSAFVGGVVVTHWGMEVIFFGPLRDAYGNVVVGIVAVITFAGDMFVLLLLAKRARRIYRKQQRKPIRRLLRWLGL